MKWQGTISGGSKTQDAVIRRLEIIGEYVKGIPEGFRRKHQNIPWREVAG